MGVLTVGQVVLVPFPFSDLSRTKMVLLGKIRHNREDSMWYGITDPRLAVRLVSACRAMDFLTFPLLTFLLKVI